MVYYHMKKWIKFPTSLKVLSVVDSFLWAYLPIVLVAHIVNIRQIWFHYFPNSLKDIFISDDESPKIWTRRKYGFVENLGRKVNLSKSVFTYIVRSLETVVLKAVMGNILNICQPVDSAIVWQQHFFLELLKLLFYSTDEYSISYFRILLLSIVQCIFPIK